jgi:hypothetical protein
MKNFLFILFFALGIGAANAQSGPTPTPPPAKDSVMTEYTGKFKFPDGSPVTEITLVYENGVLTGQTAMGNSEFKKTDNKDVFEIVAYAGTATFKRNEEGKVTGLRIQVQDIDMEGTRSDGKLY